MLLVLLLGLLLILLPTGGTAEPGEASEEAPAPSLGAPVFSLAEEERRLEATLSSVAGAGEARVLLSLKNTATRELAGDGEGTLVISAGGGSEGTVDLRYRYPEYLGAVVLCQGADSAAVRLGVTEAVSVFTGLGADKIKVMKMK